LIARLAEAGETRFAEKAAWQAHLDRLGIVSPSETGLARAIAFQNSASRRAR
jgi:hypothetical protein